MSKATVVLLAFACVLLSALAQLSMKVGMSGQTPGAGVWATYAQSARSVWVWLGLGLYAASALAWLVVLSRLDLSVAYPLVSLGFVLTMATGVLLLGEPVTPLRLLAAAFILVGVALLAWDA